MILLNINLKEMIEIRDAGGHRIKMISSWKRILHFTFSGYKSQIGLIWSFTVAYFTQILNVWVCCYSMIWELALVYNLLSITHKSNISIFWYILSVLGFWLSMLLEKRYRVYDNRLLRTFDYRSHNVFRKGDVL